jgi:hypothetical protein
MGDETVAVAVRPDPMGGHRSSSSASRAGTGVRNAHHNVADNLNDRRREDLRNSRPQRSPRESGPDVVAGVVEVQGEEIPELHRRAVHRQQRIPKQRRFRVRPSGPHASIALRVRRRQKRRAERRAPKVRVARSGGDVFGVAGRAVVTAVARRADRLLRSRARLLD